MVTSLSLYSVRGFWTFCLKECCLFAKAYCVLWTHRLSVPIGPGLRCRIQGVNHSQVCASANPASAQPWKWVPPSSFTLQAPHLSHSNPGPVFTTKRSFRPRFLLSQATHPYLFCHSQSACLVFFIMIVASFFPTIWGSHIGS